jgi:hypothetical protein
MSTDEREAMLAEYSAMRAEVLQLNSQIVTIFAGTLTLDVSVLGWMFVKDVPQSYWVFPTVGIFFLALGSVVITNRLRLAHRIGMFQKHFIEPRLPGIQWASVYFEYRELLRQDGGASTWGERLTESWFLLGVGFVNLLILAFNGLGPYFANPRVVIDRWKLANFVAACALLAIGFWLRHTFRNYTVSDDAMTKIARRRSPGAVG